MKRSKNGLALIFGLFLIALTLLGGIQAVTTFAASSQGTLNVTPSEAMIPVGSTQKFEATFTDSTPDAFNYALFSGSSNSTLTLNASDITIKGNVQSNKNFIASVSKLKITGFLKAVTTVVLNGNADSIQIGEIIEHAPSIVMPDINDEIIALAQATGQTYNGDKTYNDNNVSFNSPVYVIGNLTINCSQFTGKGPIVATGNITINCSTISVMSDSPVSLYSKNGNITTASSSVNLKGMVFAPKGKIKMDGSNLTILGRVIGKEVVINPSKLTIDSTNNDLSSLLSSGSTSVQVNWSSSNPSVATINSSGLATGTSPGTSVITAKYTINNVLYTDTSNLTVVNLSITPANKFISLGSTQQYQAKFTDASGKVSDITQSVNQWSCVSLGLEKATISHFGLVTTNRLGLCTIQATYVIHGVSIKASTSLTIIEPNLNISPTTKTISLGSTQPYKATLTDNDGQITVVTQAVTWSSNNTDVATIDSNGLATGFGVGNCTIRATYVIKGVSIQASTSLTINKPELSITPANTTISKGYKQQFHATLTDDEGPPIVVTQAVTWSSDNLNVATIDTTGRVTGSGAGACIITGTYVINGVSITASTPLSVVNFSITPASKTISLGSQLQYRAFFTDSAGQTTEITESITWSINDTNVATIDTDGSATGSRVGICIITGTYTIDEVRVEATAELQIELPTLRITPANYSLLLGLPLQYTATLIDSEGLQTNVTESVTWSSDDTNVALINEESGLATGKNVGTCKISGIYTLNGESLESFTTLTIRDLSVVIGLRVIPIPSTLAISVGNTHQFIAQLEYSDSTPPDDVTHLVTWSTNNSQIATIGATGLVTGTGPGPSIITATLNLSNDFLEESYRLTILSPNTNSPNQKGGILREWENI